VFKIQCKYWIIFGCKLTVSISVASKAMAIEQQMMEQLISSILQPTPPTALPANLGHRIDIAV